MQEETHGNCLVSACFTQRLVPSDGLRMTVSLSLFFSLSLSSPGALCVHNAAN